MKKEYGIQRKACFACITPYQLMGAISIVQAYRFDADLYLFGLFRDYDKIAIRLNKYGIFSRVISIPYNKLRTSSRTHSLYQLFRIEKEIGYFLPPDITYDYYYSTCKARGVLMLYYALIKRNPRMVSVFYEDGLGTYGRELSVLKKSRFRRFSEFVLGFKPYKHVPVKIMACHPHLLDLPQTRTKYEIETMPSLDWSSDNRLMMNSVFSLDDSYRFDESVIIFDVVRVNYKQSNIHVIHLMDECIKTVLDICSYNDVICKPHPRSKEIECVRVKSFKQTSVPIEIVYSSITDLENRILIGNLSTALFTPRMMFGKEPQVISLHRIIVPENKVYSSLFDKCREMYNNKERVVAPESIEDLKRVLKTMVKR